MAGEGNQAVLSDVQAKVQIIKPIRVDRKADLVFGQLVVDSQRGSGLVTVYEEPILEGDYMWWKRSAGVEPHPARFTVTGEEGYGFSYSAFRMMKLTRSGVGIPIPFELVFDGDPVAIVGGMDNTGFVSTDILIGGTLQISPGTLPGTYSGAFEVSVSYQ
jgi:hypothetical protein